MTFDANRDIKIEASQREDGTFSLRTRGLADRRRAELEVSGVPEPALRAAAGILNDVADYTVNRAEVLVDQNVGFQLRGAEEGGRVVMLAVRTLAGEAPKAGLWSKLTGGAKGVLRLADVAGDPSAPPLTALATMLVHRAAVRLAKDDRDGAREELETAIAIFPGEARAGRAPSVGDSDAVFNWQNHLAYLALAELDEDDAAERFAHALARCDELSERELGAPLAAFESFDAAVLERQADLILAENAAQHVAPGPTPSLRIVASPVWEAMRDGGVGRRASLVPSAFVEAFCEGAAAERLRASGARLAARALASGDMPPAALAWLVRTTRRVWLSDEAPFVVTLERGEAQQPLLSALLADIARCFRADATDAEIAARLAGRQSPSLDEKLTALETWEADRYVEAMQV